MNTISSFSLKMALNMYLIDFIKTNDKSLDVLT